MKEEEIVGVRFKEAVIFNRLTETHLDTRKHKNLMISWHPKGVLLEADGVPKVVVPAGNLVSVEVK